MSAGDSFFSVMVLRLALPASAARGRRLALLALPLMLAACGTLLAPRWPPSHGPWVPTQPASEPGDQSPLSAQN